MKRCTLDTNIITAFLKKNPVVVVKVSDYLECFDKLTINIISYYEILRGLKDLGKKEKIDQFEEFVDQNELLLIDKRTMEKAAEVYACLKKEGNLIEDADILMAATALVEDLVLVTNNTNHFERIKGLKLENWLSSNI